jgi:hypothetical protein
MIGLPDVFLQLFAESAYEYVACSARAVGRNDPYRLARIWLRAGLRYLNKHSHNDRKRKTFHRALAKSVPFALTISP